MHPRHTRAKSQKLNQAATSPNALDRTPVAVPAHDQTTLDQLVMHVQIGSPIPEP